LLNNRQFNQGEEIMRRWTVFLLSAGFLLSSGLLPSFPFGVPGFVKKAADGIAGGGQAIVKGTVQVVKVAATPVTVQVEVVKQTVKVASGEQTAAGATQAVKDQVAKVPSKLGEGVNNVAKGALLVQNVPVDLVADSARMIGGKPGAIIGDALTLGQQVENVSGYTAVLAVGNTLQGKNPLEANPLSLALAAALQSAYDQHKSKAKPIPQEVRAILKNYYPASVLANAKYVVGDPHLALPDVINAGAVEVFGAHAYAVTINDIIVFSEVPNFQGGIRHWAHELKHVEQYERLGGIQSFAYEYLAKWGSNIKPRLENEAYEKELAIYALYLSRRL